MAYTKVTSNSFLSHDASPQPITLLFVFMHAWLSAATTRALPLLQWAREFGPIYKVFLVRRPVLVVTDVQLARQLMVKQFKVWQARCTVIRDSASSLGQTCSSG